MTVSAVDSTEAPVHILATRLTQPRKGECVCCFVIRQLADFGCDNTHRHAERYRAAMAPRATAMRERLRRLGARCDCEVPLKAYRRPVELDLLSPGHPGPDERGQARPCAGVRRGRVTPCTNWVRLGRW